MQQLGGAFGESGLLVLPCVAAHLIQVIISCVNSPSVTAIFLTFN